MRHSRIPATVLACLLAGTAGSAIAQSTTLKLGLIRIDPHSSAGAVRGPFTPPDTLSMHVKPQSTVFLGATRDFGDNWQGELALGVPPTHDATLVLLKPASVPGSVAALNGAVIVKARQVAPTFFVNYRFGDSGSRVRPFVGLGLNYTRFDRTESTAVNNLVNGGPTTIKLKDSAGAAFQLGATVQLDGAWSLTGSWSTVQAKTTMTSNTLGIVRVLDMKFKPSVFTVALGYSF